MSTSPPAGPLRPAGPSLILIALLNAPAVVALVLMAALPGGDSPPWRWPAVAALLVAVVATIVAALRWRRDTGRQLSALEAALQTSRCEGADQRRQLRSVLNTAADGILTFDEHGRIGLVNAAAGRLFGYEPDQLTGQPIEVVLPDARGGRGGRPLVGTNEGKILGMPSAVEGLHRTDGPFPVSVGISKVRIKGRAMFTTIVHDLSALHAARTAAEAATRAKSQFLANVSHELRTPLGGILGMAEVLAGTPLTDDQRRHLEALERSALGLLGLVEQVLDYARLEAGEVEPTRRAFSVRHLVSEALAPLAERARAKGLRLTGQVGTEIDWVVGDADRLRQALRALVDNAVKFTAKGEVLLRVRQGKNDAGRLVFEVRDTGGGVPEGQRGRIFEPFEQGDNSSTKLYGGLGLGLSLAAQLAALMGGQITCDSDEGKGSTFRLSVPLDSAEGPTPTAPPVLLVLADEAHRRAWQEQVRAWGWPVVAVAGGKAALTELLGAVVRGAPFRAVLVDQTLPDMTGADVVRWLAGRDECRCPALLVGEPGEPGVLPRQAGAAELRQALQLALAGAGTRG